MKMLKLINKAFIFLAMMMALFILKSQGQVPSNEITILYPSSLRFLERHSHLKDRQVIFDCMIPRDSVKVVHIKNKHESSLGKTKIHPVRLSLVLGGMFTGWLGMHIYYSRTWWKNRQNFFKFAEDPFYAREVDKLSHVFTADLVTVSSSELFEWTGLNPTLSIILGSSTAIAYETYIEINDGFSPDWGFDWGDMAANFIGALYPVAQRFVKPLNAINIKWSFKPSWLEGKLRNYPDLLDDYTSMKFWITFNPYDLLPKKMQKYYPSFLGYGLGVSLRNASHVTGSTYASREYYLAFDIDITKLPGDTKFLKVLKKLLNFYHLPTPGIRLSGGAVWYGLLF